MNYSIALIPGDGIGPEIMAHAVACLEAVGDKFGHVFHTVELDAGGVAIDKYGKPLPEETLETAKQCHAVLLAAVGGPKWDKLAGDMRPERALLGLRGGLEVFANLRPARLLPQLRSACPLKDEVLSASNLEGKPEFDLLIVRELPGGIYFGARGQIKDSAGKVSAAYDTEKYSIPEIERVLRTGYDAAMKRRKHVTVVDKANILASSQLWREVSARVSKDYPEVRTDYLYVDNTAMQLVRAPGQFDVIVTSNMFGDILSDEASVLTGSIGMLASASLGSPDAALAKKDTQGRVIPMGMYEPIHGSAPDIAGQDKANPLAMILSVAMMLRYSFGLEKEAGCIEAAVNSVLDAGYRTGDIADRTSTAQGGKIVGCEEMGKAVLKAIENN
jgi:3-isopropylmalate dehydrogenase